MKPISQKFNLSIWALAAMLALFSACVAKAAQPPASKKQTVCTATINSSEEADLFKKYLPEKQFDFVELTTLSDTEGKKNNPDWFNYACEKKVQCDILIISGHFGGRFFGKTSYSLDLGDLEKYSCSAKCDGIVKRPKEVFLFGCNTLAGQGQQTRTPEQYYQVLREDGFDTRMAEQIVESVYGAYGDSNRARMKRVFQGVPHLYGFDGVAPNGEQIKPFIDKYLKSTGGYRSHLLSTAAGVPNYNLRNALRYTNFLEARGSLLRGRDAAIYSNSCVMHDDKKQVIEKLRHIENLVQSQDFLVFIPSIQTFFKDNPISLFANDEKEALSRFKNFKTQNQTVQKLIQQTRSPVLKFSLINLSYDFGWITEKEKLTAASNLINPFLKLEPTMDFMDSLCGLSVENNEVNNLVDPNIQIHPDYFRSYFGLKSIECLKLTTPAVLNELISAYKYVNQSLEDYYASDLIDIKDTIIKLGLVDRVFAEISNMALDVSFKKNGRIHAINMLPESKANKSESINVLLRLLDDSSIEVQEAAAYNLFWLKPTDKDVQEKVISKYLLYNNFSKDPNSWHDADWITSVAAQKIMIKSISDAEYDDRTAWIIRSFREMPIVAVDVKAMILEKLNSPSQDVYKYILMNYVRQRVYKMEGSARIVDIELVKLMSKYRNSSYPDVREEVVDSLSTLYSVKTIEGVDLRRQFTPLIVASLDDSSERIQGAAIVTLADYQTADGIIFSEDLLNKLVKMFSSPHGNVRYSVFNLLARNSSDSKVILPTGFKEKLDALITLALNDSDAEVVKRAKDWLSYKARISAGGN